MNYQKILKKEGIELVSTLKQEKIDSVAKKVSKKICSTFPEHNLNQHDIYTALSKTKMYFADFNTQNIGAKYYYKNQSIFFNRNYNSKKLSDLSIHECIHFIQEKRNTNGSLKRFGLYNLNSLKPSGLAINEAAVQLMSVKVNKIKPDYVKYYGLNILTPSPDYYPVQCALLNQIAFFIGTFPIFHSTLYSDDVFKTTFSTKTSSNIFKYIENSFDLIEIYEDKLSKLLYTLSTNNDSMIAKKLNKKIESLKEIISNTILNTQEIILKECFKSEIKNVRDLNTINSIRKKLIEFKELLIQKDYYDFYNIFCGEVLGKLHEKEEFIKNYGIKYYFNDDNQYLPIIYKQKYGINFFINIFSKVKKLFQSESNTNLD